jgi:cytochrome c peroxidase
LPLFRVTCATGQTIYTQDPGRALVTGKCADTGAIVPQQLRGLAARAPYFANGSAPTLRDVVEFYDRRYKSGYTEREKQDLVNFLKTL